MSENSKSEQQKLREKKEKELAAEVREDFLRRQEERRPLERNWQLNLSFINGDQYLDVNTLGELEREEGGYYWQERRAFNHIACIVDTRCCKLSKIRPRLTVRAASDEEKDRRSADLASAILSASYEDCDIDSAITAATTWSEACGTAFYKVIWDSSAGNAIGMTADGAKVTEGKARIVPVAPFEIYPHSLGEESLSAQPSIIHARAVPVEDIFAAYGVNVPAKDISGGLYGSVRRGCEVVIERYMRPDSANPDGRLTIVAGEKVLFDGPLPYVNGEDGSRDYPFVKQCSMPVAGSFFGKSIVERLIPVQRAYNAVKNRKHEFLNRISMGMLAVEEGSVDTDELAEDGLIPGKVIVYRRGGTPPEMLTLGNLPPEFTTEEKRLEEEFFRISGTNDINQSAGAVASVTSATGLQLIIEQDDARLNVCYDQIKAALKHVGRLLLRLYRQFASSVRLMRYAGGDGQLTVLSFKGSDITSDDVVLEADSELNVTPARRRAALYDAIDKGLFADEDGKIPASIKARLLEELGYNGFTPARDLRQLNEQRCADENEKLKAGEEVRVKDYDDHALHVDGHTAYLLSEKLTAEEEARIAEHLKQHKLKISEVKNDGQPNV